MYPELAQFKNWLKCQYSNSSASIHYNSDLALFFSFAKKTPSKVTPSDVDRYVSDSLKRGIVQPPLIVGFLRFAHSTISSL